ncbi:MAG: lytic murein transglycosylase B, partial [Arenicella sp.]|nr:lytic murein transglycosylase B [Arenicella sp.]
MIHLYSKISPLRHGAYALLVGLLVSTSSVQALSLKNEPKLRKVADRLIAENGFTEAELRRIFSTAKVRDSVLEAMRNPAEYKFTWGKYRKIFLQEERINQGVQFWRQYQQELERAERQYGVPASIIVAIIGVESKFGRYKGEHKVLDSLVTLVTGYPRRSDFFAGELREFLILAKENQLDSTKILGSYAGAVGFPQFISSSYRNYAVDFSGDGKVDLIDQPVDAIGSVANYLLENGWLTGQPVTSPPLISVPPAVVEKANRKRAVRYSAASLRALGAPLLPAIADAEKLNVVMLDSSETHHEPATTRSYIVRAG